jgi:hypothetical protein
MRKIFFSFPDVLDIGVRGAVSSAPIYNGSVPEIIDPVFAKTSQNAGFLLRENERFGLVFVKTGSINSGAGDEYI